MILIIRN